MTVKSVETTTEKQGQSFMITKEFAEAFGYPDLETFERNLFVFFTKDLNRQYVHNLGISRDLDQETIFPAIQRVAIQYQNSVGSIPDALLGMTNVFKNMPMILRSASLDQIECNYDSAILISAGWSLDYEWEHLERAAHSNTHLIVAVDAVYKRCLEMGIQPHIVVSSERVGDQYKFFENTTGSLAVFPFEINPQTLSAADDVCFAMRNTHMSQWFPFKRNPIAPFASVAPTALQIIANLGVKSVALVGQDLTYSPSMGSHADLGQVDDDLKNRMLEHEKKQTKFPVTNNLGETSQTTQWWLTFARELDLTAESRNLHVVTTSKRGFKFKNISYQPLSEYLEQEFADKRCFGYVSFNPHFLQESKKLSKQIKHTISNLKTLRNELRGHANIDLWMRKAPIGDLCRSALQKPYYIYLNRRFGEGGESVDIRKQFYLGAETVIREVIKILQGFKNDRI